MNVLILMPLAEQRGGAEQMLRVLLKQVDGIELDVSVVFLEEGPLHAECRDMGIPSRVVPAGRLRNLGRFLPTVRRIAEATEQTGADLIFSWMAKAHLYGVAASWMTGVPSAWYQFGLPQSTTWLNRLVSLLPAAGIVACSRTVAEVQREQWPHHATKVVRPCVDLDRFDPTTLPSPAEARQELGLPHDGPLIGMVGRLQRWKGMHTLVDAMPQVLAHHPDAHAVIVGGTHPGEPGYATDLDHQIAERGLEDRVVRVGFQSDVPRWMTAMDVFVHASDREPFGIVILEAMALGTPVVAGARGGPTEIITEGEDGLLAPYNDAEVLARQIRRYLDDPDFAQRVGTAARQRALHFAPEAYAERFAGTITDLAREPTSASKKMRQIF
ncbi:MAG: glycosyltransferase family 4 protein [Salinibacter sp.]|uniref:glycosyltransferase family 4 protein n=1 Tax=Salinibacter sp. TaxID=2065818 RepID=UPI0035D443DF